MKTKKLIAAWALMVLVCGCGNPERSKLVGEWKLVVEDESAEDLDRQVGAGDAAGRLVVTFAKDGTLKTVTDFGMARGSFEGTWEFVSSEENGRIVHVKCNLKGDEFQTRIEFEDDDQTIRMVPPNLKAIEKQIDPMKFAK